MSGYFNSAINLHRYLVNEHWTGNNLAGPDPVGKIHWRVTRFLRSYFPWIPYEDQYIYLQGQSYWIKSNQVLYQITNEQKYFDLIENTSNYIVDQQLIDGAWLHPPIRGRKGFISSVEGGWASLGLITAFRTTGNQAFLASAINWFNFLVDNIGFQKVGNGLAVNYYAHSNTIVPNVTTKIIWLSAELNHITKKEHFLNCTDEMIQFIENSQLDSGEIPYAIPNRTHFMCFQYNAFQFLDLANYFEISKNERCRRILVKLVSFLATGMTEQGSCRYSCSKSHPEVIYWNGALAAALRKAQELGFGDYLELSERAYSRLFSQQNPNGSFGFSKYNYGLLQDKRSYPRYQSMILYHLLIRAQRDVSNSPR